MIRELVAGVAAGLILTPAAFAQPTGAAVGVQPYRPASAPPVIAPNTSLPVPAGEGLTVPGPTSGTCIAGSINATLLAGQVPSSDATTVGAASAGPGRRTPSASVIHSGPAGPTYGGSTALSPGAVPDTGPGGAAGR
jgi:hypothetical protein